MIQMIQEPCARPLQNASANCRPRQMVPRRRKVFLWNSHKTALVDVSDYRKVSKFKWHKRDNYAYAVINKKSVAMHRLILGVENIRGHTVEVDHIDHNGLNNTRQNIHCVTHSFNLLQAPKQRWRRGRFTNSIYKGVYETKFKKYSRAGRWRASAAGIFCGNFQTEKEAALAYDKKLIEILGKDLARIGDVLNFKTS